MLLENLWPQRLSRVGHKEKRENFPAPCRLLSILSLKNPSDLCLKIMLKIFF